HVAARRPLLLRRRNLHSLGKPDPRERQRGESDHPSGESTQHRGSLLDFPSFLKEWKCTESRFSGRDEIYEPEASATVDCGFSAGVDVISYPIYHVENACWKESGMAKVRTDGEPEPKPLVFLHGEIKTPPFSDEARREAGFLLRMLQRGEPVGM